MQEIQVQSQGREVPLEKEMATPVFLPGESHGQRSLVGYGPWGYKELDMTEQLSTMGAQRVVDTRSNFGVNQVKI